LDVSLNRLPPRRRAEMIAGLTGGKALPNEIADQIIDRTDGVPLFIENRLCLETIGLFSIL
jgi:predicted ATPase